VHRLLWPAVVLACCAIAVVPAGAQNTPSGRVGAYYFDGWAGPLSTFFFNGLIGGPYNGRRPLTGWRDDTAQSLDKQLSWAGDAGIGFFAFDWYFGAESRTDGTETLNHALANYRAMSDHHGVNFALLYVNAPPFEIPAADWPAVSEAWVDDMANPSYERVDGKPILLILNSFSLSAQLGGEQGVNRVFSGLRQAARRRGLPGVFIIGGIAMQRGEDWNLSGRATLTGQTYDVMTQYNYVGYAGGAPPGERVYQDVVGAEKAFWEVLATEPAYRYVPDVMAGWDPRPWNETFEGQLFWFKRSAAEVQRQDRTPSRFDHCPARGNRLPHHVHDHRGRRHGSHARCDTREGLSIPSVVDLRHTSTDVPTSYPGRRLGDCLVPQEALTRSGYGGPIRAS
jgi:hypothetical protein